MGIVFGETVSGFVSYVRLDVSRFVLIVSLVGFV